MKRLLGMILCTAIVAFPLAARAEVSELRVPMGAGGRTNLVHLHRVGEDHTV